MNKETRKATTIATIILAAILALTHLYQQHIYNTCKFEAPHQKCEALKP